MDKYILSVRPKWLAKILNRQKTIELRKTAPKTPCVMLLYCTKERTRIYDVIHNGDRIYDVLYNGKQPIFVRVPDEKTVYWKNWIQINGKIVGQFTLERVDRLNHQYYNDPAKGIVDADVYCIPNEYANQLENKSCVSFKEMCEYGGHKDIFAWHISDLVIFDEPKELSDYGVKRAPQSYMKVKGV